MGGGDPELSANLDGAVRLRLNDPEQPMCIRQSLSTASWSGCYGTNFATVFQSSYIESVLTSDGGLGQRLDGWWSERNSFFICCPVGVPQAGSCSLANWSFRTTCILSNAAHFSESFSAGRIGRFKMRSIHILISRSAPSGAAHDWRVLSIPRNNLAVQNFSMVHILVFTISIHNIMCTFIFTGRFKPNLSAYWYTISGLLAPPLLEMRNWAIALYGCMCTNWTHSEHHIIHRPRCRIEYLCISDTKLLTCFATTQSWERFKKITSSDWTWTNRRSGWWNVSRLCSPPLEE